MTTHLETRVTAHGLAVVLIPRGLTAEQQQTVRARLGLTCRHGRHVRATYGRCPACRATRTAREGTAS